jgi:hypothetical protein
MLAHIIATVGQGPRELGNLTRPKLWLPAVDLVRDRLVTYVGNHGRLAVLSGMEQGWGLIVAAAALQAKDAGHPVGLTAVVPYPRQPERWGNPAAAAWHARIRERCIEEAHCGVSLLAIDPPVLDEDAEQLQLDAVRWMVGRCDRVMTCWDGQPGPVASQIALAGTRRVDYLYQDVLAALGVRTS